MSTHYINKSKFLKELSTRIKGVDLRKSGRMAKYGFAMEDGESFSCVTVATMVKAINKIQEGTLIPSVAKVAGTGFIIAWEEVVEDIVPPKSETIEVTPIVDKPVKKTKKASKKDPE